MFSCLFQVVMQKIERKNECMQFSVLMSVYKNEKVDFFRQAMDSVLNQTVMPTEIVLVRDGLVYDALQETIDEYLEKYDRLFTYIPLEENGGLGNALRIGLENCRCELVARMDTDDVCIPDRFEKQLNYLSEHPEVDMVGGNIAEFKDDITNITDYRCVPSSNLEIKSRMKSRCPFNHVTVMFRKKSVMDVGNYQSFYLFEDYYLWIRMQIAECCFANVDDVLCNVRVSDMASRRGGMKYFKSYKQLLKFMKQNRVVTTFEYVKYSIFRFSVYVLCSNKMREWTYKKFLRKKKSIGFVSTVTEKVKSE